MTNYEALYNQAMVHNSILRALSAGARIPRHILCNVVQPTKDPFFCNCGAEERQQRLDESINATIPDEKAWLEARDKKAVEDYLGGFLS